jgi:hypothetical protein
MTFSLNESIDRREKDKGRNKKLKKKGTTKEDKSHYYSAEQSFCDISP